MIEEGHYYTLVLWIDGSQYKEEEDEFKIYERIEVYDSLSGKRRTQVQAGSPIGKAFGAFHDYWALTVLSIREPSLEIAKALKNSSYKSCPKQENSYDCGLFCLGVLLNIYYVGACNQRSFSQVHITKVRKELASVLAGVIAPKIDTG